MSDGGSIFDNNPKLADEALRRLLARQGIQNGHLPARPARRVWGGKGSGEACTICNLEITPQQLGFELEFGGADPHSGTRFLHGPCLTAWEIECRNGHDEATPQNAGHNGHPQGGRE